MSGRKPVDLTASAGALTVRDRIWAAIRRARIFTAAGIARGTGASDRTVEEYVQALVKAQIVERVGYGERPRRRSAAQRKRWWREMHYRLARDAGVMAPRLRPDGKPCTLGLGRELMWTTVKALGECDARAVAMTVACSGVSVSLLTAKTFLNDLAKAGYVARTGGGRGQQRTRYTFLPSRNTGPRAPVSQKNGAIFDPNTGKHAWQP